MIGGLLKSSSKLALMAAAGILVGGVSMGSAKAADLGGDCCADLEERVAELEATTARKGNRKVSLSISGQVNRAIMYLDNGITRRTYAGLDNHNSSTRFIFSGSAKVTSSVTAGFEMMTEWNGPARTGSVTGTSVDGGASGTDGTLGVRTANWWLEDKTLGRVTVGRLDMHSVVGTIDIGGISVVGSSSPALIGGKIIVGATGAAMERFVHPTIDSNRIEAIRYNSASIAGLTFSATYGENEVWGGSARYAAEFSGIQVAAGIGYHEAKGGTVIDGGLDTSSERENSAWGGSVALKHVATGIFVQGMYTESRYKKDMNTSGNGAVRAKQDATANFWEVQAGVSKNWFGPGNTNVYGEVGQGNKYAMAFDAAVTDSVADFYGIGLVQNLDAAAMELYVGWRHMDAELTKGAAKTKGELDTVTAGARIKF